MLISFLVNLTTTWKLEEMLTEHTVRLEVCKGIPRIFSCSCILKTVYSGKRGDVTI